MEKLKEEKQKIVTDRRIMTAGVILAVCCLAAGIYWKYRYRLDRPVFVETDQAISFYYGEHGDRSGGYGDLTFYYITGKEDRRVVSGMEFPQMGENRGSGGVDGSGVESGRGPRAVLEGIQETIQADSQYVMHTLNGRLFVEGAPEEYEGRIMTEAKVFYTDGSTSVEPIGRIVCMPDDSFPERLAESSSASSGSDGWNEIQMRVMDDAVLYPLGILAEEQIQANFDITVNGIPYGELLKNKDGLPLKQGDTLRIVSQWNEKSDVSFPVDPISELVFFELSGERKQYICFKGIYQQQSGSSFLRTWNYLNEKGAFSDGGQK